MNGAANKDVSLRVNLPASFDAKGQNFAPNIIMLRLSAVTCPTGDDIMKTTRATIVCCFFYGIATPKNDNRQVLEKAIRWR